MKPECCDRCERSFPITHASCVECLSRMRRNMDRNTEKLDNAIRPQQYRFESYTMLLTVYNEEARVKRVVEYYRPFAKLIVVDNYSEDATVSILNNLGVKLIQYRNPGTAQTPECIKYFFSLVDTDYILFLSCSEFMPVPLLELFEEIAKELKQK